MPASHEVIGREIQWTGDGRSIDFHASVGPSGASTISTHQAGFTHGPRGGWVSIWEHFVLQVGYAMTERRLYPVGPATVRWHDAPRGGIHVHVIAPLTPTPTWPASNPSTSSSPWSSRTCRSRSTAATATASRSPAPGCPRRPAPRRPDRGATGTDPGGEGPCRARPGDRPR